MATLSKIRGTAACAIVAGVALALGLSPSVGVSPVGSAQEPASAVTSQPSQADTSRADLPRLRIATTAVEIDAVVTTRSGQQVTDLRPEDVELFQDGRKQQITSVRYVAVPALRAGAKPDSNAPEDVRRTVAIVIDDLNMSFGSMYYTRAALAKFVHDEIQPGDRVAVIRGDFDGTRTEWFTGDKRALQEKVGALRYNVMSTAIASEFEQIGAGQGHISAFNDVFDLQKEAFTVGTLGTINAIVRAMKDLPGRKALVLASDGFSLLPRAFQNSPSAADGTRTVEAIKRLVDDANRSFVVLYAVDTRRLVAPREVSRYGRVSFDLDSAVAHLLLHGPADGPAYLAHAGGGFYLRNSNDLKSLFTKVLNDQNGYYLVSYEPDDKTFQQDAKRRRPMFHSVKLKVNRPNVRVRARAGFFGVSDEDLERQRPNRDPQESPAPPPTRHASNSSNR